MFLLILFILLGIAGFYGIGRSKRSFRRILAGELTGWVEAGIIKPEQAAQLQEKYQLDRLAEESQATLLKTLFMFGAVLIALGVVAFVAAQWELIPKHGRWILVTLAMAGSHSAGYCLWKGKNSSPYLGHALIILGSLIFGADIALIAQIFHLPGDYHHGFLLWSLGVFAVGYAVQSVPHLLMAVGASLYWFIVSIGERSLDTSLYLVLLPAVVLPYAYRQRSRGTHFGLGLAWAIGVAVFLAPFEGQFTAFWLVSGVAAVALGLWGYGDLPAVRGKEDFRDDSKIWSVFILSLLGYSLTFHTIIAKMVRATIGWPTWERTVVWAVLWIGALVLLVFGYGQSLPEERRPAYPVVCLCGAICTAVGLLRGDWTVVAGTVAMNAAVILLGGYLFWKGLSALDRRYFWLGLALLVAAVVGRFFEYNTGLLWKSAAFILAGIALIYGGILFEKKRGRVLKNAA